MTDLPTRKHILSAKQGIAACLLVAFTLPVTVLWPSTAAAKAPQDVVQAFAFCTVTDSGSARTKIWASPVFPYSYASSTSAASRLHVLGGEFLSHVNSIGGAGSKQCTTEPTQALAESTRAEQRASWSERVFMVKIGDWRDVAWAPAPHDPLAKEEPAGVVTKYFRCYAIQTDIPDRSDRSRTVTSPVFARTVPAAEPLQMYVQAGTYVAEFAEAARAQGIIDQIPSCEPHDTAAEADKAQRDFRKTFSGFNMKFSEIAWEPSAQPVVETAPVTKQSEVAVTSKAAPSAPTLPVAATPASDGPQHCVAFVSRTHPSLVTTTPVWTAAKSDPASLASSLAALASAVIQSNPGEWQDFPAAQCVNNSAAFAGETFCFANGDQKRFSGMQLAAQFCNASRPLIEKRWEALVDSAGPTAKAFPWSPQNAQNGMEEVR